MPANTTLLEFTVDPKVLQNPVQVQTIQQEVQARLESHDLKSEANISRKLGAGGFLLSFTDQDGRHAVVRAHEQGLVTLDLHEYVNEGEQPKFTGKVISELEKQLAASLPSLTSNSLPAIRRGAKFPCYFPTADELLIEYDFDECVFHEDSLYQNVKIMHSKQFGNMLLLDNDPNLAESDLPYTRAITGGGKEDYKDRTVLILGGGDGGILHELLKENPKLVIMVDIDAMVIDAAKKYLRRICYDSLDNLKGDNYEVYIEDCVPILERYIEEGRVFDYVINDLTAIPVSPTPVGNQWDFLRKILDMSMKVLAPTGKYFTQGNGLNMQNELGMYEAQLAKLSPSVQFEKETVCVPSYHELWVFYKIWKSQAQGDQPS